MIVRELDTADADFLAQLERLERDLLEDERREERILKRLGEKIREAKRRPLGSWWWDNQ